jgi:hypothetical protein
VRATWNANVYAGPAVFWQLRISLSDTEGFPPTWAGMAGLRHKQRHKNWRGAELSGQENKESRGRPQLPARFFLFFHFCGATRSIPYGRCFEALHLKNCT